MAHSRAVGHGTRRAGLWLGLAACVVLLVFPVDPGNPAASRLAGVAVLMAVWWVTEAIPLFATALAPLVLFPLLGIMAGEDAAPIYFNSTIVLFVGGFLIALTMEKWSLHKRIALGIIHTVGSGPSRIVLGFMLAAAFLSMWISNTATAVMMVPIGLAMVLQVEESVGPRRSRKFATGLMLAIAYACSMGGLTTLVGTPPNLSFQRIFGIIFPDAPQIAFGQWIVVGLPVAATMLVVAWLLITRFFFRAGEGLEVDRRAVERERAALGPISFEERAVLGVFVTTALLWVFRKDIDIGLATVPGWSRLLADPGLVDDGTVAIAMASLLFFIPARNREIGRTVMGPDVITKLPWGIVLLFGGGFALAAGFQETGLAQLIGERFEVVGGLPVALVVVAVCLLLTFLTELTSNLATTEMILPILASVAVVTGMNPLILMVPATLSASCAFMMPVATPPNAIVFGSGRISVRDMVRVGLVLNLIGAVVIMAVVMTVGTTVFGIDPTNLPDWAGGRTP